MLRRARLHLPAPIGHDNGSNGSSSDEEDYVVSPSVACTSLRDDESVWDQRLEDVSGVHLIIAEEAAKVRKNHVAELSLDEQRSAADAWARLQTLYELFRELEVATDEAAEDSDSESVKAEEKRPLETNRRQRRYDERLRSLLQEAKVPFNVILRDLTVVTTPRCSKGLQPACLQHWAMQCTLK